MAHRTSRGRLRPAAIWILAALAVPCLLSSLAAGAGLPEVITTGICPPAPPDISAYPCSPQDYLLRMTVGPWALAGHLLVWGIWLGTIGIARLVLEMVRPAQTRDGIRRSP